MCEMASVFGEQQEITHLVGWSETHGQGRKGQDPVESTFSL